MPHVKTIAIETPPIDDLGPAMRALDERQRRFVMAWVKSRGKNGAACARSAGYSDHKDAAKVAAHVLLRNTKIIKALQEEAERQLDGLAVIAVMGLGELIRSPDRKVKQTAIDSVLDRTGFSRRTQQDIKVEHTDNRSTAELLALVEAYRLSKQESQKQIVDSTYAEVTDAKG